MASAKLIFKDSKVYADGTSPLMIQVIHRRQKYAKQITKLLPAHWDEKKKIVTKANRFHIRLNQLILTRLSDVQKYLLDCDINGVEPDPRQMFKGPEAQQKTPPLYDAVLQKAQRHADKQQFRSEAKFIGLANKIKESGVTERVDEVTPRVLERFAGYLIRSGNKHNTVAKAMENLSTVFNELIREKIIRETPFDQYKITRKKAYKSKLTEAEFELWCSAKLARKKWEPARDTFTLSVMLRGMRAFDILTLPPSALHDGRIRYTAQKTGKPYDIKVPEAAMAIIDRYLDPDADYILPWLKLPFTMYKKDKRLFEKHVNARNSYINTLLKEIAEAIGIKKRISMHIARHTFGYLADRKNISVTNIQAMYGHSSLKETEGYIQELRQADELDEAVEGLF